ncbi:glycosyl transferase [Vibrio sp. JC009]|uniref:glycosyltransferase family 32 protein n=1 Tax=Vibrio sp. JC009 TaxID=2912314 RepID=UPI0023AF8E36|nr:glycosyltransferase [Vibrio sp. JC009]WED21983.1 glycosyl transferase [Vibrio sp. JC009]
MNKTLIVISNRLTRLFGNIFKMLSYPFHWILPKQRFAIPEYSKAKVVAATSTRIPKTIWQTNFSNQSTLPVYLNYLFNRFRSLDFDYRYVSTEEREEYIKQNASERVYNAYMQLKDGASQADFWRLITLNNEGGIYMDIDATLVRKLNKIIGPEDDAVYVTLKKNNHYTNFFLASAPNNPVYKEAIDNIVKNIEDRRIDKGVYGMTGPGVLTEILETKDVKSFDRKYVCIQGAFTNEHFQYLDRPRTKWTHKKPEDLLK